MSIPRSRMRVKSVFRLGRTCRFIYGFGIVLVILYLLHDLSISISIPTAPKGRSLLGSIYSKVPNRTPAPQRNRTNTKYKSRPPVENKPYQNLFRSGQKIEKTIKLMQSHKENNFSWHGGRRYCENNLEDINDDIVYLRNVVMDTRQKTSKVKGGEPINAVMKQKEQDENVDIKRGFFRLPCSRLPPMKSFHFQPLFTHWFAGIEPVKDNSVLNSSSNISNLAIFRIRGDYANLYWTLIELYDTYLTVRLLRKDPKSVNVILVDAHPQGKLDDLWVKLFGYVTRIGNLDGYVSVSELAWSIQRLSSPISQSTTFLPFIQDFKQAFYSSLGLPTGNINWCSKLSNRTRITLILRRNYVAHPRNPTGKIMRKILNEKELVDYLEKQFSNYSFRAVQLDDLSLDEQLRLISETAVLIGVHGAGLAYNLLLRQGAASIELFPARYKSSPNRHFQQFATWGDVHYLSWFAPKSAGGMEWIKVPLDVTENLIRISLSDLCKTQPKPIKRIIYKSVVHPPK